MRQSPIDVPADEFRAAGHELVDIIADFLSNIEQRPVARDQDPADINALLPVDLPVHGKGVSVLLREAAQLLMDRSTFSQHPQFYGYIIGSAAPIGVLADFLASAINPNMGGWSLSPVATEIEKQALRWISRMIGFPEEGGGIFVSGGNMANMIGMLAARAAQAGQEVRTHGLAVAAPQLTVYASPETHTWLQKGADLFGIGTNAVRWIRTDAQHRLDASDLRRRIAADVADGFQPFLVVGTAGTVSTGAVDPLTEMRDVCDEYGLWLHVDGAYGGLAAMLEDAEPDLKALSNADSVAVDPHKWLYAPMEAGVALVRDPNALLNAFSYRPSYYHFEGREDDPRTSFYELGIQNSRGFRALKVWLAIRQVGMTGYRQMLADDIRLSRVLFDEISAHPELEAVTQGLSITTFRYVPPELRPRVQDPEVARYLDELNTAVLTHLQGGGEVFVSNAVVQEKYVLRACIVNWRTTEAHVRAVPEIVARTGRELHADMQYGH